MGSGSKIALFLANFIVFAAGVAVVVLASIIISRDHTYGILLRKGIFSLPIVMLVVGVIILLIGAMGCCGAILESSSLLYTYAGIVFMLLIAEIVMGTLMLVYTRKAKEIIMEGMDEVFEEYGQDMKITKAIDEVQQDLKCCGVESYSDWEKYWQNTSYANSTADSCCKEQNYTEGCGHGILNETNYEDFIYTEGCFYAIKDDIKGVAIALGVICLILAAAEALSIVFACQIAKEFQSIIHAQ